MIIDIRIDNLDEFKEAEKYLFNDGYRWNGYKCGESISKGYFNYPIVIMNHNEIINLFSEKILVFGMVYKGDRYMSLNDYIKYNRRSKLEKLNNTL